MFDLIEYAEPVRTKRNLWVWAAMIVWVSTALLFEEYFHRNALAVTLMPLLFLAGTGSFWKRTNRNWVDYLCTILWIMFAIMIAIGGWFHWWLCWLFLSVSTVVFALLERLLKRRDTKKAQLGDPQA